MTAALHSRIDIFNQISVVYTTWLYYVVFFFSSRRRHTRLQGDWSSDVCSSDLPDGQIILIDEALTPDSSRFWPAQSYQVGKSQASFDKQYVRDYLERLDWNKQAPAPSLPDEVARATTARYLEAYELLVGEKL